MHVTPLWQKFKQLGTIDKEILHVQDKISDLALLNKQISDKLAEEEANLAHVQAKQKKIAHTAQLKEAEVAAVQAQITLKNKQLEAIANTKQQQALEAELQLLKKNCNTLEDAWLEILVELEQLNNFMKYDAPMLLEKMTATKAELTAQEQELETLQKKALTSSQEQSSIIGTITPEWFAKYQAMKSHVADPITPVVGGVCGSCFYEILAQDLVRLKNNAILPCQSCFRLLYFDTETQQ